MKIRDACFFGSIGGGTSGMVSGGLASVGIYRYNATVYNAWTRWRGLNILCSRSTQGTLARLAVGAGVGATIGIITVLALLLLQRALSSPPPTLSQRAWRWLAN